MIKKGNKRITITLSNYELERLEQVRKNNIHFQGLTKTQIIKELLRGVIYDK